MRADRPFFLVGCPRSGTTLLSTMLHAHPRLAMPPETRFLQSVYFARQEFGDLGNWANRRRLAERITGRDTKFRDLGLTRKQVIAAIVAAPPTIGTAMETVWREFARSRGKERWGDKRPNYALDTDAVLRLFPDAQLVHLMRDPRACVASLQQVPWWERGVPDATATWALTEHTLRRVRASLPSDQFHYLRYEDLLHDPEGELRLLCKFLGEDFDAAMLDHAEAATDIVPARKSWHERTLRGLDTARTEAWHADLSPAEIGLVEKVTARAMRRHGYPREESTPAPSARALAGYGVAYARGYAYMARRHARDRRAQRTETAPVATQYG